MSIEWIPPIMLFFVVLTMLLGVHVAWAMGGVAVVSIILAWNFNSLFIVISSVYGVMTSSFYVALPLFIAMGVILERSGIADDLYQTFYVWAGRVKGGLAVATVLICVIFAAMTGLTGAACITMGLIALPSMLKRGYNKDLAIGTVIAPATLGILIPPSVVMIMLGTIARVSVGKLFFAGLVPGLCLAALFIIYILIRGFLKPELCPSIEVEVSLKDKLIALKAVILPFLTIFGVLGAIFFGIATPTESASIGVFTILLSTVFNRTFNWKLVFESSLETFRLTVLNIWIIFGALVFASTFTALGGIELMEKLIMAFHMTPWMVMFIILVILFILGMFIDPFAIIFLVGPLTFPMMDKLGFDVIWYAIVFIMLICIGYITPPFGANLFYMKSVAPPDVSMGDIYHSSWPFVIVMLIGVVLVIIFPDIVLWLPNKMIVH
ncbi:MAG: Sialic acid TRAP transporter permease protein SiaT [Synergistetes bacterium ADurb.Bin155]|jgi:tripartite ATP-independent transporter DctM subunit|nr:TRAP transporter large permease subunit [Synergistales bacterium]MBP8996011.1 TRAP transporter large permease subunit [Synergistales bacterium]NMD16979.1 TRAP transporter large permease subunit [Synergistaceae bacterium]OQB46616.1 MAG: Sialic acid TRAP transporter permease protein SiaT [Synergistetes bacterium ADurb.Bin155]HOR54118.1 TRAP transporter large permease subunit [Synergistales bacterium]